MNHPFTTAYNLILLQQRKRVLDCIYTESKALWLYTFILLNVLSTPALAERLSFDWNSQATVELDQGWLTNPWSTALDNHPSFLQVERAQNLRGQQQGELTYPCLYKGQLNEDTCLAYNWGSTGFLKNPIALPTTDRYLTRESKNARLSRNWGVPEMIDAIIKAIDEVHDLYPNTKRLVIGDLSRKKGGHFPPHLSHQSGRDADIGYYIKGPYLPTSLVKVRPRQLDVERTWAFVHSFLKENKVQYIFMDYHLQRPLYKYAKKVIKLSPRLLNKYFSFPRRKGGIIRHLKGHADHMHIRFYAPASLSAGEAYLKKHGRKVLKPVPVFYRIRRGDTLVKISRKFRIKWNKLMRWNRLSRRKARRLKVGQRLMVGHRTPKLP